MKSNASKQESWLEESMNHVVSTADLHPTISALRVARNMLIGAALGLVTLFDAAK